MDGLAGFWAQSDLIGRAVAALLLGMSVGAWVLILWKTWVLRRARRDLADAMALFWAAPDRAAGRERAASRDREGVLVPLLDAAFDPATEGTLEGAAATEDRLTRRLRDALHAGLRHLQSGQVFLASVGATSPFIGLFGTVWGIYHALLGLGQGGTMTIERIAGPVGEALVMTAAGLAVAIPAVLAYNVFNQWLGACEAELEGFAHDLRGLALARR